MAWMKIQPPLGPDGMPMEWAEAVQNGLVVSTFIRLKLAASNTAIGRENTSWDSEEEKSERSSKNRACASRPRCFHGREPLEWICEVSAVHKVPWRLEPGWNIDNLWRKFVTFLFWISLICGPASATRFDILSAFFLCCAKPVLSFPSGISQLTARTRVSRCEETSRKRIFLERAQFSSNLRGTTYTAATSSVFSFSVLQPTPRARISRSEETSRGIISHERAWFSYSLWGTT